MFLLTRGDVEMPSRRVAAAVESADCGFRLRPHIRRAALARGASDREILSLRENSPHSFEMSRYMVTVRVSFECRPRFISREKLSRPEISFHLQVRL